MTNELKEFINSVGAMTEVWTIAYKNFVAQGYTATEALVHTREYVAALLIAVMSRNGNKEDKQA